MGKYLRKGKSPPEGFKKGLIRLLRARPLGTSIVSGKLKQIVSGKSDTRYKNLF